jgi:imidazolonepropionase-like amidohydrolase
MKLKYGVILLAVLCSALQMQAADPPSAVALKGATIHTAAGEPIAAGVLILENGRISAVGADVPIPDGMEVLDVAGKVIIPGLIDPHSHIGTFDANDVNEMPQPIGPENRALDAVHLGTPDWQEAVAGGVTVVITGPGSGERMGGQSVTLKTFGEDLSRRILKEDGDLKMAVNARHLSHMTNIYRNFLKAREYMAKWEKYEGGDKNGSPPKKDLAMEALARALKQEVPVRVHIYPVSDMISFVEMKKEFGFDLQFIHSVESYKIAPMLAEHDVGCICLPLGMRYHVTADQMRGIAVLHNAGVKVALHTDHPVIHQKWHRINGSMAIRYGLPEEAALRALTINAAEMAGVSNRVGTLEPGKDADIVLLDGPWYELSTRVEKVFVDGILAFDRTPTEDAMQEDER